MIEVESSGELKFSQDQLDWLAEEVSARMVKEISVFEKRWLSIDEAAMRYGVSEATLRRAVKGFNSNPPTIKAHKIPGFDRVKLDAFELDRWMEGRNIGLKKTRTN